MSTRRQPDLYLSVEVEAAVLFRGTFKGVQPVHEGAFSDATRLWRLITVIGPAVITTTFKDTRAVSIQKYNNSKEAHRAISLKVVAASIMVYAKRFSNVRSTLFAMFERETAGPGEEVRATPFQRTATSRGLGVNWNVRIIAPDLEEF